MRKLFIWAISLLSLLVTSCGDDETTPEEPVRKGSYLQKWLPLYVVDALENAKLFDENLDSIYSVSSVSIENEIDYTIYYSKGTHVIVSRFGDAIIKFPKGGYKYINWAVREGKVANNDSVNNTVWIGRPEAIANEDTANEEAKNLFAFLSKYAQLESSITESVDTIKADELSGMDILEFKNTTCFLTVLDTVMTYECAYLKTYRKVSVESQIITTKDKMYKLDVDKVDKTIELLRYHYANKRDTTDGYYLTREYKVDTDTDNSFRFIEDSVLQSKKFVSRKTWNYGEAYCYRQYQDKLYLFDSNVYLDDNEYIEKENTIKINKPFEFNTIKKKRIVLEKM